MVRIWGPTGDKGFFTPLWVLHPCVFRELRARDGLRPEAGWVEP